MTTDYVARGVPSCLPGDGSLVCDSRLLSLWDILNIYHAAAVAYCLHEVTVLQSAFVKHAQNGHGSEPIPDMLRTKLTETLNESVGVFDASGMSDCSYRVQATLARMQRPMTDVSSIAALLGVLHEDIFESLKKRKFLCVSDDRSEFLDKEKLFGESVFTVFPSARYDIKESGNCLAVECTTACVFHLMRVAEHGIRALAHDRQVTVPNGPIELATWEQIIVGLEKAESSIQQFPKTVIREVQLDFYHGAMMEFRAFKNKFRNGVMHTRDEYDRDEAMSAFIHVRSFMQILSGNISEQTSTPWIWV